MEHLYHCLDWFVKNEDLTPFAPFCPYERRHRGYRNTGRKPIETIEAGKAIKEQVMKEVLNPQTWRGADCPGSG